MRALTLLLPLALSAGLAQEAAWKLEVEPRGPLLEGQPAELQLTITHTGDAPVVVLFCQASLGRQQVRCPTSRTERGLGLQGVGGGVLTLTARAEEGDLGPAARAPRPPLIRPLGEADYLALDVVAPGGKLTLRLTCAPLAALSPDLAVTVHAAPVGALPPGRVLVPAGAAGRMALQGEGGGCTVEVEGRLWRPLAADEPAAQVLLAAADARALVTSEVRLTQRLELTAREPSSTAALKRAGIGPAEVEEGAYVAGVEGAQEAAWLLDGPEGAFLVPAQGEPSRWPGCALLALGQAFQAGQPRALLRSGHDERLHQALTSAQLPCTDQGKALEVPVTLATLPRLLATLQAQGYAVRRLEIVRAP